MGGAAPFVGALDAYATSLVHLYDPARRWLTAYTGNLVLLRRASDNAELAFTYDSTGELDLAAIAAWAGGASYIVTLYDQKGTDNVTQATAANQPLFTASAQNGHAGMTFDGTNDYLRGAFTNGGALSQPLHMIAIARLDASVVNDNTNRTVSDGDDSANRGVVIYKGAGTDPDTWESSFGATLIGPTADSNANLFTSLGSGVNSTIRMNGALKATGNAGTKAPDGLTVGTFFGLAGQYWKGWIAALLIFAPALSDANRNAVEGILNTYWAVY